MEQANNYIKNIINTQRTFFNSNKTKDITFRKKMLCKLKKAIKHNEKKILRALYHDLGKSKAESYMSEIAMVYHEIDTALSHIEKWSRPMHAAGTLSTFPAKNYIYSEPYGIVLILAPWNYPVNLSLCPLVGVIAAGNCAILKCSKSSLMTSDLIQDIINSTFNNSYIYCTDADIDYDAVLNQKYDYIFFTGSPAVGKQIMKQASENLTPISLELGGKSPCIIDETADLKLAAKRIAWGKFLNAGQTCISIDYVLIHEKVKNTFIKELFREIKHRYKNAAFNSSYPKIINRHHYNRLKKLLASETKVIGGICNDTERKISPAILPDTDFDKPVMQEEIFGPLLPIISYRSLDKAIQTLKTKEKPLACYVFTKKKATANKIIHEISYGRGCINDVVIHISNHNLPFGGVGNSGIGGYHGKYSFETFSHRKSIVKSSGKFDIPLRYAPYGTLKYQLLKRLL